MSDRHAKWQRVEPGTVVPAGQPFRAEHGWREIGTVATESIQPSPYELPPYSDAEWFVDSSWKPPLVLPTEPCVIRAKLKFGGTRVLFGHPNPGEDGMTFCRAIDGLSYRADEIESFEVLWVEGQRGKDALVPWEAIDKLKKAYPSRPGAVCEPVDYFLREVVGDR